MKKLTVILPNKATVVIRDLKSIWVELDWGRSIFLGKRIYVLCFEDAKYKQYVALASRYEDVLQEVSMAITKAYAEGKEFIDLHHDEEE